MKKMSIVEDFVKTTYQDIICPHCKFTIWRDYPTRFGRLLDRIFKFCCMECGKHFRIETD